MTAEIKFEALYNCPLCGSKRIFEEDSKIFFNKSFYWYRCRDCTFYFQNPRLTQRSIEDIYNSDFYWNGTGIEAKDYKDSEKVYQNYLAGERYRIKQSCKRLELLKKFISPPAKLLDIACATGFFGATAKNMGFEAEGVELSRKMAAWGEQKYGLKINAGRFEDIEFSEQYYDIATIWGSDTNFYDPLSTFKKINFILKPGGLVMFNYFDFDHFTKFLRPNFKKVYSCIYNLNSKTVPLLLSMNGFEIIYNRAESQYTDLHKLFGVLRYFTLLKLINKLKINFELSVPTICGYCVIARKKL